MATHSIMGSKVHVYMRENSTHWQCSTFLAGKNFRVTTKTDSLSEAKDFAEDWYLTLRGKLRVGDIDVLKRKKKEPTFREAAAVFVDEYAVITQGQRSPSYVRSQKDKIANHLNPFFGDLGLSEVTSGKVQDYRVHRMKALIDGKPIAPNTLHQEMVALRQVLKTALRHGWIDHLPDLSAPYRSAVKISHRAWFSPEEYTALYKATAARAKNPKKKYWAWASEQLHDYVLFMANTGLRPDEAKRLEFRDVEIGHDDGTREEILTIAVRGKRGVGYCKSTHGAVEPFRRLLVRERKKPQGPGQNTPKKGKPERTDLVFPGQRYGLFNAILDELKLKLDREGNRHTPYSLRHTYICLRLMAGADIYQIAKNCRTSVEMIQKYYAAHIKNMLDAAAINVKARRPRPADKRPTKGRSRPSREHRPEAGGA